MKRLKKSNVKRLSLTAALLSPGAALAHHGDEPSLPGQLMHVLADPFHLSISLLVAAGIGALLVWLKQKRKDS